MLSALAFFIKTRYNDKDKRLEVHLFPKPYFFNLSENKDINQKVAFVRDADNDPQPVLLVRYVGDNNIEKNKQIVFLTNIAMDLNESWTALDKGKWNKVIKIKRHLQNDVHWKNKYYSVHNDGDNHIRVHQLMNESICLIRNEGRIVFFLDRNGELHFPTKKFKIGEKETQGQFTDHIYAGHALRIAEDIDHFKITNVVDVGPIKQDPIVDRKNMHLVILDATSFDNLPERLISFREDELRKHLNRYPLDYFTYVALAKYLYN